MRTATIMAGALLLMGTSGALAADLCKPQAEYFRTPSLDKKPPFKQFVFPKVPGNHENRPIPSWDDGPLGYFRGFGEAPYYGDRGRSTSTATAAAPAKGKPHHAHKHHGHHRGHGHRGGHGHGRPGGHGHHKGGRR